MKLNQIKSLDRDGLGAFPSRFSALAQPALENLPGYWKSHFTGPAWLRTIAPPGLGFVGLGGWWGKLFADGGSGDNLVGHAISLRTTLPFTWSVQPSRLDGKPALVVAYLAQAAWPWPWVIDELRQLTESFMLGMTLLKSGPTLAMPFLLERRQPGEN